MQYALYGLGYYDGKFNGNLNTLDSRKSIEAFQKNYKIKENGVLADEDKQQLLFINELYAILLDKKTTKEKRNEIFDEVEQAKRLIGGKNEQTIDCCFFGFNFFWLWRAKDSAHC